MTKTAAELDADIAMALAKGKLKNPKKRLRRRGGLDLTEVRHDIDDATKDVDTSLDPMQLALMASDAYGSCRMEEHKAILASIPPIKLGRTVYRVVGGGRHGLDLAGPRGGYTALVQSTNNPTLWAHNSVGGKSTWYKRNRACTTASCSCRSLRTRRRRR